MRKPYAATGFLLSLTIAGCVSQATNPPVIEARPVALSDGAAIDPVKIKAEIASLDLRPIGFARVQTTIPRGSIIGVAKFRPLTCYYESKMHYDDDRKMLNTRAYNDIFFAVFNGYGYNVVGNPNAIFATPQGEPDLQIGASIAKADGEFCRHVDSWSGKPDGNYSGTMKVTVNWQLFDPVRRRIVWQKDVDGVFTAPGPLSGDYELFVQHAFADSANKLAADPSLREMLKQRPVREASVPNAPKAPSGSRHIAPRQAQRTGTIDNHVDQLRSATVMIEAGGLGSGFLVREDGLVVTNHHVVRNQRFVNVTLVSGRSAVGEVLYRDEFRDVALLKIEGSGYPVVSIRETPVRVAEEVYAIGSPRFKELGWTVTRGVVSAYRQGVGPERLDFIQADVAIHGGNSGGPLFDRHGNAVGIAVHSWAPDPTNRSANTSLSGFIPILDGLQKLGIDLVDPAAYERARRTAAAN